MASEDRKMEIFFFFFKLGIVVHIRATVLSHLYETTYHDPTVNIY